jgi:hypothetical protein
MGIELTTTDNATLSAIRQALQSPYELRPNKVIVGGDLTGIDRGLSALDIQTYRDSVSSVAIGNRSVAIGSNNQARDAFTVTIGTNNTAPLGVYSQYIGHNNSSNNSNIGRSYNTLIGTNNQAFGQYATILGNNNSAGVSVDVGQPSESSSNYNIAVGAGNISQAVSGVAIGFGNRAGQGGGSSVVSFGIANQALNTNTMSIGVRNTAAQSGDIAIGRDNKSIALDGCTLGISNSATNIQRGVAIGNRNNVTLLEDGFGNVGSVAVGYRNTCSGYYGKNTAIGYLNTVTAYNGKASAFGYRVTTTVDNTQELGYWSNATTRNGAVRIHGTRMVAVTLQNKATAYGDGGATAGSEADDTLMREAYAIRRNGDVILIDINVAGTVKTLSLGTAT